MAHRGTGRRRSGRRHPGRQRARSSGAGRRSAPRRTRRSRTRGGRGWYRTGARLLAASALTALAISACASPAPREPHDACAIFDENLDWYESARSSEQRWGIPIATQLAVVYQESSFEAQARPPRTRRLLFLPGPRPSSAYGYGQVVDSTWASYQQSTGRTTADRDDFADVSDFIGWYGHMIRTQTGIAREDAYRLYLAYHEGPRGYLKRTHQSKPWLERAAQRVAHRASTYERQLSRCAEALDERVRGPWWWPF